MLLRQLYIHARNSCRSDFFLARHGEPENLKNFFILHEGVIAMADGTLTEMSYGDVEDHSEVVRKVHDNGGLVAVALSFLLDGNAADRGLYIIYRVKYRHAVRKYRYKPVYTIHSTPFILLLERTW